MFRLCFLLRFLRPRLPLLLRDFFDVFLPLLPEPWPCLPSPGDTAPFPDKSTIAALKMSPAGSKCKIAGSRLTCDPVTESHIIIFLIASYPLSHWALTGLRTYSGGCSLLSITEKRQARALNITRLPVITFKIMSAQSLFSG